MARRYGIAKSNFLEASGDSSLGVMLAQGEAHTSKQTNDWLAQHGVSLDSLQHAAATRMAACGKTDNEVIQRSKTLILVKNLSGAVSEDELAKLFSRHGQLGSVRLVPSNTLALVEFLEVGEARKAFRALAYHRLHGVPLYLEWAPLKGMEHFGQVEESVHADAPCCEVAEVATATQTGTTEMPIVKLDSVTSMTAAETKGQKDASLVRGPVGRTLFVKNLNFSTSVTLSLIHI